MMNNMMMKLIKGLKLNGMKLVLFDSLVQQRLGKSRYKNPTIPIEKYSRVDNRLAKEYDSVKQVVDYQPSYVRKILSCPTLGHKIS